MERLTKIYHHFNSDSLYRNSIYLMLSTAVMAFFGFFFWIINTKLYTPDQVGIATTLISVAALISSFCILGLGNSLIKYLPTTNRKNEKINTSFTLVGLVSILSSIGYLVFLTTFSPKLIFIRENVFFSLLFILFILFTSLNTISENVFIAYRSSHFVLIKNIIFSLAKLTFPFILITLGAYGIFISVGLGVTIAFIFSLVIFIKKFDYIIRVSINKGIVGEMARFSLGNYISDFIGGLSATVLPIIILNSIGAKFSAYFYMDMMIANLLFIIPYSVSQSLFAEGSYSEGELKNHLIKAFKIISLILLPAVIFAFLFGQYILLAFGKQYSTDGTILLRIFSVGAIFLSVNYIGNAILFIKHKIKLIILINSVRTAITLLLSYLLIKNNLIEVGVAWVSGIIIADLIYLFIWAKARSVLR